eukprot:TRINITY_DN2293_c0_g1_i2.p1 TRINITY_DN2293_c0_g1~~TRINITY_DN2293_c0_g1_i2.p1  ORF type:complete len:119 (+),score=18.94 TRINITY_DN2293_c0_g1_i2:710-1066(+)
MLEGINSCKPGRDFSDIGYNVEKYTRLKNHYISPYCSGHGVGKEFHIDPSILFIQNPLFGKIKPGMIFTIEPVVMTEDSDIKVWDDQWTLVSQTGCLSAQFENTILITDGGPEILTSE